jgi:aryl carrier-like protein
LVYLDSLPLTPNGKIDRKALPPPSTMTSASGKGGTPRTETAKVVAALWSELLQVDGIGIEDDFFDLGGDSMTAVAFVTRLHAIFGCEVGLAILFERPTIAGISEILDMLVLTSRAIGSGTRSAQREEFEL